MSMKTESFMSRRLKNKQASAFRLGIRAAVKQIFVIPRSKARVSCYFWCYF